MKLNQLPVRGRRVAFLCMATAFYFATLLAILPNKRAYSAQKQSTDKIADASAARKAYSDHIAETYNFAFDRNKLSAPGNAAVVGGNEFIQPEAFPTASYCGHCHQEAYHQWRQSLHSNAFRTPFYRASVNILINTAGIQFSRHCDSCHNPIGVLSGALTQNSQVDRKFDQDGLTCTTCHSIQKTQSTLGNGSYVMGVPAVLVDEKGNRVPGIPGDEEILAHLDRHSKAVMQDLYRTPEFCSACHKANLPHALNDYKELRAFTTYDEWQNSKFSRRNPLTFYTTDFTTCQNCHMMRGIPSLHEPGAKNGTFVSHRWLAGNTAVPFYYGFDEQLSKTIGFLKSGNYLNVDLFGIKKNSEEKLIAPLGSTPFSLAAGDVLETMVVVQNKNIGHSLLPEVRDLYEAWIDFQVTDSVGKTIYHNGFLKPDGSLDERAHSFTNRPVNIDEGFVDNHRVSTIHSTAFDNTVQAGRSTLVRYRFQIPRNVKGDVTVTARVQYRHLRQSYLNNVFGKDHPAYPVVELAARSRVFHFGQNKPTAPEPKDNPDWMRWNNLGIAYLDQLHYAEAVRAFTEVINMRPDYADGYTNVGLTELVWEKFASARSSLEKSLALIPNNARATYYMALVERRAGNNDAEIADLKKVIEQFPQSRDARKELGISYYQHSQPRDAVEQFEKLQAIDPDDLAAHYNLAILYRRLGMKDKAAQQAAMFADKKADPGAPQLSLDFLRKHPEISTESVPWHVHTDPHMQTGTVN